MKKVLSPWGQKTGSFVMQLKCSLMIKMLIIITAELLNRERPMSADTARPVPNIYSGVESEEEKRRARSQQAMYRRLFMDIEREQVKENIRRQEHRKRIQRYSLKLFFFKEKKNCYWK